VLTDVANQAVRQVQHCDPETVGEDTILARLLALNLERSATG
jgi:hypothetical protein